MRTVVASSLLPCLLLLLSRSFNLVKAEKLRRGSGKQNDEMDDMSLLTTFDEFDAFEATRSLSTGILPERKTPPYPLGDSKCGLLRKQHPGCTRVSAPNKPPSIPTPPPNLFNEELSPPPTTLPTTAPTPLPTLLPTPPPTPPPTILPTTTPSSVPTEVANRPLNCVQSIQNDGGAAELTIEHTARFYKGDVHCLSVNGQEAYFGYTWTNQFGLFVNGQSVWELPYPQTLESVFRWTFQGDGNLVMRNENDKVLWMTGTCCYSGSRLKVSMERVWIESRTESQLWSEPFFVTPAPSPPPTPPPTRPPTPPPTPSPTVKPPPSPPPSPGPTRSPTPPPTPGPTRPPTPLPTNPPTRPQDQSLRCVQNVSGDQITIPIDAIYRKGDVHCLRQGDGTEAYFGYTWSNQFGLFVNGRNVWTAPDSQVASFDRWSFQGDGNLVLREGGGRSIWTTQSDGNSNSNLRVSSERVWIERTTGSTAWSQPPYLGQPPIQPPISNDKPNPHGGLQYYAYYYPWYLRNNWSRHGYQDEPLLGKYGTNEVGVAEQHIEWALQTGISTWIVSWWGPNSLAMKHFKQGMMNAPSLNKMKFCMLYETVILDDRGSWRDGSKEEALYRDLRVIVDEFFNHPSYLKINGRPVIIFYISRSRMPYEAGFNGPAVIANMRRRLGHNIYFIADEPFFDYNNKSPDGNENAFKNGKQVFDAYTTYNMFQDSRVRRGETATDYQLRESMPVWKRWAEKLPLFPNVMPQYYDFRGHKPLLGNSNDFMKQLRAVACLPRTNFNGAPHIMMITSFNEWWEGTQIEPENGSSNNWNNYGFQFMETLAAFKKDIDFRGTYWC